MNVVHVRDSLGFTALDKRLISVHHATTTWFDGHPATSNRRLRIYWRGHTWLIGPWRCERRF